MKGEFNPMPKKSQEQMILEYLQSGKSITPIEALNLFGVFRLSGRIYDLKAKGYQIEEVDTRENGKTFAKYYLLPENESAIARNNQIQEESINFAAAGKERQEMFL